MFSEKAYIVKLFVDFVKSLKAGAASRRTVAGYACGDI
jgi:hypothetical protein